MQKYFMQPRRAFVFQENFFTGANISFGNFKMNLQSDELVNENECWEEFAPIIKSEKIRAHELPEILYLPMKIPSRLIRPL